MSVHIKCDRCKDEIPYAEDVEQLYHDTDAWWDAVKRSSVNKSFDSDDVSQLCGKCYEEYLTWFSS